jgi:hypothetical protein
VPIFRYDETLPRGDERNKTPESRASLATTESLDHGTLALMDDVPDRSDIHPHTHATSVAYRPIAACRERIQLALGRHTKGPPGANHSKTSSHVHSNSVGAIALSQHLSEALPFFSTG